MLHLEPPDACKIIEASVSNNSGVTDETADNGTKTPVNNKALKINETQSAWILHSEKLRARHLGDVDEDQQIA